MHDDDNLPGSAPEEPTSTSVRRYKWLQDRDTRALYDTLDAGLIAHIAYQRDGFPIIIPMNYVRDGHSILMHGSTGAGVSASSRTGQKLSLTVSLIDGLVYEYSLFNSTVNYRSVMVFGEAIPVDDPQDKLRAVHLISERLMPGRWDETPPPTRKELAATHIIRIPLDHASTKIRTGGPSHDPVAGVWTGHVPITTVLGEPVTQPGATAPICPSVAEARRLFDSTISVVPS